jgi:hypothetical protein
MNETVKELTEKRLMGYPKEVLVRWITRHSIIDWGKLDLLWEDINLEQNRLKIEELLEKQVALMDQMKDCPVGRKWWELNDEWDTLQSKIDQLRGRTDKILKARAAAIKSEIKKEDS